MAKPNFKHRKRLAKSAVKSFKKSQKKGATPHATLSSTNGNQPTIRGYIADLDPVPSFKRSDYL